MFDWRDDWQDIGSSAPQQLDPRYRQGRPDMTWHIRQAMWLEVKCCLRTRMEDSCC